MRTYRAGLIGCGRIGAGISDSGLSRIRSHAEAYRKHPRIRLVAACDIHPGRLRAAAKRWGIPATHADFRSILEKEKLDLLSIAAPEETHAPILLHARSRPGLLGVLLEKPVAPSAQEARDLLNKMTDSSVRVSVHYGRRFCPVYRRWAEAVHGGVLGQLQHAHGIYTGGMDRNGTHLLDLLLWFLGEPDDVDWAQAARLGSEPAWSFRLCWPQGARATVEACDPGAFNIFELDLVGTKGRLRFSDLGHRAEHFRIRSGKQGLFFRALEAKPRAVATGLADSARFALQNLLAALEGKEEVRCSLQDGVRALEWASRVNARATLGVARCQVVPTPTEHG